MPRPADPSSTAAFTSVPGAQPDPGPRDDRWPRSPWRRIVVKLGTSSLTDVGGRIEQGKLAAIAAGTRALSEAHGTREHPARVVLVSSGAGAAGRERLGLKLPLTLPQKQAAAAVGQSLLMRGWAEAFAPDPVAQLLLTAGDVQARRRYVNAKNALEASLAVGAVPIVNENDSVATAELKVGDNDTLSAWVSYLVDADVLIILTDVDGLYDVDPRHDERARRIAVVDDLSSVRALGGGASGGLGTGGMGTKLGAAKIASDAGIPTIVLGGGGDGLLALARGERRGTLFVAGSQVPTRKAWIANQPTKGVVRVDAGAANALHGGRSLLPKGVIAVEGEFGFGDAVDVRHDDEAVGVGLSNYSSADLARIVGRHTSAIAGILGAHHYDEVIHRDNLLLVRTKASTVIALTTRER